MPRHIAHKELRRTPRTKVERPIPMGLLVEVIGVPEEGYYSIMDLSTGLVMTLEKTEFNSHFRRL